jgi:hypothetical protein
MVEAVAEHGAALQSAATRLVALGYLRTDATPVAHYRFSARVLITVVKKWKIPADWITKEFLARNDHDG